MKKYRIIDVESGCPILLTWITSTRLSWAIVRPSEETVLEKKIFAERLIRFLEEQNDMYKFRVEEIIEKWFVEYVNDLGIVQYLFAIDNNTQTRQLRLSWTKENDEMYTTVSLAQAEAICTLVSTCERYKNAKLTVKEVLN
ncbi:hypothetical protein RB666_002950 [Listeria monocytogenes]|nr:hypothetical protein [Listeria monocytogenes]